MPEQHSRQEILSVLRDADVAAVATSAGDKTRTRMMHFAVDEDFTAYMATMKGDPKTVQIAQRPWASLLVHKAGEDIGASKEVEITGSAFIIDDPAGRQRALELTKGKSPVVKHLVESGNPQLLDCIKLVPETVKLRVFDEIVQGLPPTVIEFPQNRLVASDWALLKRKVNNWFTELRAPFLTASVIPVLLGTAVAWAKTGIMHWGYFLLALLAGMLLHAGTNIINDYFDHRSGNDALNREFVRPFTGGSRMIQLGLLSPLEVLIEGLVCFFLGSLIGLYLAWAIGPVLLPLGVVGILSGFFYTGRPLNWASRGVGEALVGINFGLLMTLGAYYVQTGTLSWLPVIAAIPVALLIAAVLYINEFPDYAADKAVGKNTLVVRLGRQRAVVLYAVIMAAVYVAVVAAVGAGTVPLVALLALITLPLAVRAVQYAVKHHSSSFQLVPANALTINGHMLAGLFLTLAFVWHGLGSQGLGYMIALAVILTGLTLFMYRQVEAKTKAMQALKDAVLS